MDSVIKIPYQLTAVQEAVRDILIDKLPAEKLDDDFRKLFYGYQISKPEDNTTHFIAFSQGDKRIKIKTGRFVAKKLKLKDVVPDYVIQSIADEINDVLYGTDFTLFTGQRITDEYKNHTGGSSCMSGDNCIFTKLYENNPDQYSIAILKSGSDTARAILIKLDNGKFLLDRIYATNETLKEKMQGIAIERGYLYRYSSSQDDNPEVYFDSKEIEDYNGLVVSKLNYIDGEVPYQDTLVNYQITGRFLKIFHHNNSNFEKDNTLLSTCGLIESGEVCSSCGERCCEDDSCYYNDEVYCSDCYHENFAFCERCEETYPNDKFTNVNDEYVCEYCLRDKFTCCEECHEYSENDKITELGNGTFVCERCLEENYMFCGECEEYTENTTFVKSVNLDVCDDCLDSFYVVCENCGKLDRHNSIKDNLCHNCFEE